jgi:phage terminase large subunit
MLVQRGNHGSRTGRFGVLPREEDEQRDVGLGPEHDWSSHAADAFGLMAIAYEEPSRKARFNRKIEYPQLGIV